MHKIFTTFFGRAFLLLVALFPYLDAGAQNYNLSATSGTFTTVTGTRVAAIELDEGFSGTLPIGFTFNYFGNNYTEVKAFSNGFLTFDLTNTNDPSNTIAESFDYQIVAPLWDDLDGTGGQATYSTTGTAGSRVFTMEWLNYKWSWIASSAGISFQVKLYEGTNVIEFIYRQEAGSLSSASASVGLIGNVTEQFYSLANVSSSPVFDPNGNDLVNTKPATGQAFSFTPTTAPVAPSVQATNITALVTGSDAFNLQWTNGGGAFRAVFIKQTSAVESAPVVDGTFYKANSQLGSAVDIGSGWYCVYNGTGNTVNVTGLLSGFPYRVQIVEYNGQAGAQKYLTTSAVNNPVNLTTVLVKPSAPLSTLNIFRVSGSEVTLDLIEGNGDKRAVFVKAGTSGTAPVVDNTTYTANSAFGLGTQIGNTGWYCVFNGTATNSFTVSGLTGSTAYRIHAVDYNGSPGSERYNIGEATNNPVQFTSFVNIPVPTYTFAASTTTFTPLTGATALDVIEADDMLSNAVPIGFTFRMAGVPFTELVASSNGFLSFNPFIANVGGTGTSNNLQSSQLRQVIAPLWDDVSGSVGQASYTTTGTSPNRVFTVEYLNWKWNYNASAAGISFQVKLYETSNKIEFIYRQEVGTLNAASASIGLAFANNGSGNFLSLDGSGASPAMSTSVETSAIAAKPATGQVYSFTPVKINQVIAFNAIPDKAFGADFALNATSSSGLAVTYTSSDTNIATVSGNTVTPTGVGTVTITAYQAGDDVFNAAAAVPQAVNIIKGNQTITFAQPAAKTFGDAAFSLVATSSSGLAVTFVSSNTSVATITGSTVTILASGTTDITASQAGNANYNAASNVIQTLTVNKANQTITFNALTPKLVGDAAFDLTATASSGLSVTYASSNSAVATVSGNTLTVVGSGTTDITASQAGNANYNAAASVVQPFTVKSSQTITFEAPSTKTIGDAPFSLSATASSGLSVTFSSTSDKVTISGNQVTVVKAGSVTIQADQPGNGSFAAAPTVERTFCINPAKPSITSSGVDTESPVLTSSSATGNQWFKDGVAISGATGATFTVLSEGVYTVVTTADNCSSVASNGEAFVITGTEQPDSEIGIFPNPAENEIVVDVTGLRSSTPVSLSIFDASGRTMHTMVGNGKMNVRVTSYRPGSYVLKVQHGKRLITKQIIKK